MAATAADDAAPPLSDEEIEKLRKRIKAAFDIFSSQGDDGVLSEE